MKSNKNTIFSNEYIKVKNETFESMNNVIKETKKVLEFQPKIEQLINEVKTFSKSHQILEKENINLKREVKSLTARNQNLTEENNKLRNYIETILESIKKFFRKILQIGNEKTKGETTIEVKDYYDNNVFDMNDVIKISRGTTKQDELFEYVEPPDYLQTIDKVSKLNFSEEQKLIVLSEMYKLSILGMEILPDSRIEQRKKNIVVHLFEGVNNQKLSDDIYKLKELNNLLLKCIYTYIEEFNYENMIF